MLAPHTVLNHGRYRIVRSLGEGGMGHVYEAHDERLGRRVALKQSFFVEGELADAFRREARLLSHLRHNALPVVSDYFDEGGSIYLAMDYVGGEDLADQLSRRLASGLGPFPVDQVLDWADELLDALSYLHNLRPPVLHRDVKPRNLKVTDVGRLMLLDFGLAKGRAWEMTEGLSVGSVMGSSKGYSPLEQVEGTGTEPRSDLYAVAATLYHLMTGVRPPDAIERAVAQVKRRPDPLRPASELAPHVPVSVSAVLTRALALDADERPESATAMRDAMRAPDAATEIEPKETTTRVRAEYGPGETVLEAPRSATRSGVAHDVTVAEPKPEPVPAVESRRTSTMTPIAVGTAFLLLILAISYAINKSLSRPAANTTAVEQQQVQKVLDEAALLKSRASGAHERLDRVSQNAGVLPAGMPREKANQLCESARKDLAEMEALIEPDRARPETVDVAKTIWARVDGNLTEAESLAPPPATPLPTARQR